MAEAKVTTATLATGGNIISSASSHSNDRLAASCQTAAGPEVQIWEPTAESTKWELTSQVSVQEPVLHLCWASPENGLLLAGATATGAVYVLEAPRPTVTGSSEPLQQALSEQDWRVASTLQASRSGVRHLSFAPSQYGLLLCAACGDGTIMIWEADRPLAPNSWCLQARFKVHGPCTGLSWRHFSPGVAPLLCIATMQAVEVWQYSSQTMAWRAVTKINPSTDAPCKCVDWAPTMGRPVDLIAVSHGHTVDLWSLHGDTAAGLQTELVSVLDHDAPVWKVEFNMLGTCLATATEDNKVLVWRANLVGEWCCINIVQGSADAVPEEDRQELMMLASPVN